VIYNETLSARAVTAFLAYPPVRCSTCVINRTPVCS